MALLTRLRRLIDPRPPEESRLVLGGTGSGKSEGELVDLMRIAARGDTAVVLLDGHGPLAARAAEGWAARGHAARLVYEPLAAVDRTLAWSVLTRSAATHPGRRRLDDLETRDEVSQCVLAPRHLISATDRPYTKEWLDAAIDLALSQPVEPSLAALPAAFRPASTEYRILLAGCDRPAVAAKFAAAEALARRAPGQYDLRTGAARRLLEAVCEAEPVRLRARPGPFDWADAVAARRLVAFDGGGLRSREVKRTLFLLAALHVVLAVRRHFAARQTPRPVVLVLEEAGALDLAVPFVLAAFQELRKAGLAVHLIAQSAADFADPRVLDSLLANAPTQVWHRVSSPADQQLGGAAVANATFDARALHFTRRRTLGGTGEEVTDAYYRTPAVQEQEARTRLATLRVGERLVLDRAGARVERVRPLPPPRDPVAARAAVARAADTPFHVSPPPEPSVEPAAPSAAERLPDLG